MASDNNIFEVLQKVAENNSSNEKLFDILKENGYTGTLEDAGREIQKAEQVILENLTSDDLKNIAGGKILMNEKVKKAFATSTAALLAASAVPSQAATEANLNKQIKKNAVLDTMKNHPYLSATTASLGISTVGLLAASLIINSKLQTAKSGDAMKTGDAMTTGDAITIKDAIQLLNQMQHGTALAEYLFLLANDKEPEKLITLQAFKDANGQRPGVGSSPAQTYVKVTQGTNEGGGLCAEKAFMPCVGKYVRLDHFAAYLVCCSGWELSNNKPVILVHKDPTKVKRAHTDPTLGTCEIADLTPNGQFLARLTANVIMRYLGRNKSEKQEEEQKKEENPIEAPMSDNNENDQRAVDPGELRRAKEILLTAIAGLNFEEESYKSVLKLRFTKANSHNTIADPDKDDLDNTNLQILPDSHRATDTITQNLLENISNWKGNPRQVIMHLVAVLLGRSGLEEGLQFPDKIDIRNIRGYKMEMFNELARKIIEDVLEGINVAYTAKNTVQK